MAGTLSSAAWPSIVGLLYVREVSQEAADHVAQAVANGA